MPQVRVVPAGEGEIVGDSAERRVEILSDDDALHATWSRFAAGRDGADLHIHRRHTDLFYVLGGELTIRLGPEGDEVAVAAGTLARVPPMVVHGFRNASAAEVRYLNLHAPGEGFAAFMRGLRDGVNVVYDQHPPPADGGRPASEATIGGEVSVETAPGRRTTLLCDTDQIEVSELVAEPAAAPSPKVLDRRLESLYVLDGALSLKAGDREVVAGTGSWLQVPAGTPRAVVVPGPGMTRFLRLRTASAAST